MFSTILNKLVEHYFHQHPKNGNPFKSLNPPLGNRCDMFHIHLQSLARVSYKHKHIRYNLRLQF